MKRFDIKDWRSKLNESNEAPRRMTEDEKKQTLEAVSNFNEYTQHIYKESQIKDMMENIRTLAENASKMAIEETADWFDVVSVKRDTKAIGESVKVFESTAKEIGTLQQRLESVFEDIGAKLGKYYEIKELNEGGDPDEETIMSDPESQMDESEAQDEYQDKFRDALEDEGVESPADIPEDEKAAFFDKVDKSHKAKNESTSRLESMLRGTTTISEAFGTWTVVFDRAVVSGVKYDGKQKYTVSARNTSEAIKKAVKQAGGKDSDWMAVDVKSILKNK